MNVDMYLDKHRHIGDELKQLSALVSGPVTGASAAEIAAHINKLTGILMMHLSSEDKLFYPVLLASPDVRIKSLAQAYQKEMGGIAQTYAWFKSKYNTPSAIFAGKADFVPTLKTVIAVIEKRIVKEETELYPAAAGL